MNSNVQRKKGELIMKKFSIKVFALVIALTMVAACFVGCAKKEEIVIYTSIEDYRVEYMQKRLNEQFPDYKITVEYKDSGSHAAAIKAAGKDVACDITHDLEYGHAQAIAADGALADLTGIVDFSVFSEDIVESKYYLPEVRNGGAIIINPAVLEREGIDAPKSYADLLDPKYKGLISMPNPASSGTGYMFLLNLVNEWGEEEALEYFDALSENVLSFTSSGSGPVNALIGGEVAVGLGMTSQAVTKINEGAELDIVFFEEGSPYSVYGQGIIAGREENEAVVEVFKFLANEITEEMNELYYPEKLFADKSFSVENFPKDIVYGDMSNNTAERKDALLKKWNH